MKVTKKYPGFKPSKYSCYRHYTRQDFGRVCAYCFRHEEDAGGIAHFDQDHFKPKHLEGVDPENYFNLYWSCKECNNSPNKYKTWPSDKEIKAGRVFCDPCQHDPHGTDYEIGDDALLKIRSPAGSYTIRKLRLNEREELLLLRQQKLRLKKVYEDKVSRLETVLQHVKALGDLTLAEQVKKIIEDYRLGASAMPFVFLRQAIPPEIPDKVVAMMYRL